MKRQIVGFGTDTDGDWFAELDCGHAQHVRHKPPFIVREWVTTHAGRDGMLGESLDCVRCDRFEWPDTYVAYQRTRQFDETTIPVGLRRSHSTRAGVWAKIVVLRGTLRYRVDSLQADFELSPSRPGIVVPEVEHHVEPIGSVLFYVEFYRSVDH